ncbi:MAG: LysR family transcriptional regulator [Pseudomonadota bacterium]
MVTLRQLKFFNKVMETRNITQAAEQLHIAQPALGTHIRELEAELGAPLLNRHSRGVEPTPAAVLLQARANAIFEILDRTVADINRMATGAQYKFNLGLTTSLMLLIGPDLLLSSRQQTPAVSLQIHESPSFLLVEALERREIDAALAYCVDQRPGIECTPVLQEQLLFVNKAVEGQSSEIGVADLDEVLQAELVLGNERDVARRLVTAAALQQGVPVKLKYETQSIAGLREIVLRGAASAVLPYGSVARDIERGELCARRIMDPLMYMTLYTLRRSDRKEAVELSLAADEILQGCVNLIATRSGLMVRRV